MTAAAPTVVLDVHTHCFPPGLPDLAETTGDARWPSLHTQADGSARLMRGQQVFRPVSADCWDLDARLASLDARGVDVHVLSPVPVMLTTWADDAPAADWAKACNDALAAAIAACAAPHRYRWLAMLPLQDPVASVAELQRALALGAVGVEIGTEVDGRELDHPSLAAVWEACEGSGTAVFVHPTDGAGATRRGTQPYEFGIGMLTDTALAAGALLFGGVLERHPQLRIGLAHGCGALPWMLPRLARGATLASGTDPTSRLARAHELCRSLWADTLVFDPEHLPLLMQRFGAEHLMLGSDHPFYPPHFGDPRAMLHEAAARACCSGAEAAAMQGENALAFLGIDAPPTTA